MTNSELRKLKKSLPKGYRKILASKKECRAEYIDAVLSGRRQSIDIIESAVELAKAHKEKMENLSMEIKQL
jgi:hypothetical protein